MKKVVLLIVVILINVNNIYAQETIAVMPFTGVEATEGDTLAEHLSRRLLEVSSGKYTIAPRTAAIAQVLNEQNFQRSGLTDADTIGELGKGANATFVVTGHIQQLGERNLIIVSMTEVETLRQTAGAYLEYNDLSEMLEKSTTVAENLIKTTELQSTDVPVLAVLPFVIDNISESSSFDSEVLSQILSCDLANTGRYAVVVRTSTINQIMVEHKIQRNGLTNPESIQLLGKGMNATYVLSGKVTSLGSEKLFATSIMHTEKLTLISGGEEIYHNLEDGLNLMEVLSFRLTQSESLIVQNKKQIELERLEAEKIQAEQRKISEGKRKQELQEQAEANMKIVLNVDPSILTIFFDLRNILAEDQIGFKLFRNINGVSEFLGYQDGNNPNFTISTILKEPSSTEKYSVQVESSDTHEVLFTKEFEIEYVKEEEYQEYYENIALEKLEAIYTNFESDSDEISLKIKEKHYTLDSLETEKRSFLETYRIQYIDFKNRNYDIDYFDVEENKALLEKSKTYKAIAKDIESKRKSITGKINRTIFFMKWDKSQKNREGILISPSMYFTDLNLRHELLSFDGSIFGLDSMIFGLDGGEITYYGPGFSHLSWGIKLGYNVPLNSVKTLASIGTNFTINASSIDIRPFVYVSGGGYWNGLIDERSSQGFILSSGGGIDLLWQKVGITLDYSVDWYQNVGFIDKISCGLFIRLDGEN